MLIRISSLGLIIAMALCAPPAMALPFGESPATVSLGSGMTAERFPRACGNFGVYGQTCIGWRLTGATAPPSILDRASTFAGARGGRIVAGLPDGIVFSDDRGRSWHPARWEGSSSVLAIAFDMTSDFGVAVGVSGCVWTTDDRGSTWRQRRDDAGTRLIDVGVAGRVLVWVDDRGGAWFSPDGGTSVRTLVDPATAGSSAAASIVTRGRTVFVLTSGSVWWRADASGNIERAAPGEVP